jgi:hypothetical protein
MFLALEAGPVVTGLLEVDGSNGDDGDNTLGRKMLSSHGIPAKGAKLLLTFRL